MNTFLLLCGNLILMHACNCIYFKKNNWNFSDSVDWIPENFQLPKHLAYCSNGQHAAHIWCWIDSVVNKQPAELLQKSNNLVTLVASFGATLHSARDNYLWVLWLAVDQSRSYIQWRQRAVTLKGVTLISRKQSPYKYILTYNSYNHHWLSMCAGAASKHKTHHIYRAPAIIPFENCGIKICTKRAHLSNGLAVYHTNRLWQTCFCLVQRICVNWMIFASGEWSDTKLCF